MSEFNQLDTDKLREYKVKLQEELAQIDREELKRVPTSDEERLANSLHKTLCSSNHIDGCSWEYEFDGPNINWDGYAHLRYLRIARIFMESVDATTAIRVLAVLNEVR